MKEKIKLLVIVFSIPLIAIAVSVGIQNYQTNLLHTELIKAYPTADKAKIYALTLSDYLKKIGPDQAVGFKRAMWCVESMKTLSICYISIVALLFALVRLVGIYSSNNRERILQFFKPLYFLTTLTLIISTPVNAALAVSAIYFGETYLIGRLHYVIVILAAVAGIIGSFIVIKNTISGLIIHPSKISGELAGRDSKIFNYVHEIVKSVSADKIDNIIIGNEITFFVSEGRFEINEKIITGRTLYLSKPLCEFLTTDELKSIIGHELAHYIGNDTKYSLKFYPIYRGVYASINALASASRTGFGATIALLQTILILNYFLDSFKKAERNLSREREQIADQLGVTVSNEITFGSALVKTSLLQKYFSTTTLDEDSYTKSQIIESLLNKKNDLLASALRNKVAHPYDSHPSLQERLKNINADLQTVNAHLTFSDFETAKEALL